HGARTSAGSNSCSAEGGGVERKICDGKRGPRRLDHARGSCARGGLATRIPGPRRLTGFSASPYITYRACPGRRDWTAVGPTNRRPICELPFVHERPVRVGR